MKKLNQEQFKEYIKKNGLTKARLSLSYYHTPKETILWFGLYNESISTYNDDTENKNKEFGYDFFYERIFDSYGGVFIIDDEEMKKEMKNKIVLESNTELRDNELREWVNQLNTKIDTINDRTKKHTLEIKQLKKEFGKIIILKQENLILK